MEKELFVTRSSMPTFEEYTEAIKPLFESHWLTNVGIYHQELEKKLADYLSVPQLSLMVNGHMALELGIQSFGFPEGGEVITTPFTFISTTHAIVRNRLQPVFCDVKSKDGTIDESRIEDLVTERTVAILPVHVYGNVCNVEEIQRIADKFGLKVIYDAAHAFGVKHKGEGIGNLGDASIFSFHATKIYNTIEGGAVVCKNSERYEKLYNLKNFGIRSEELVSDVGANAKMNEFAAIMGLCNLKRMDKAIAGRKRAYEQYMKGLAGVKGLRFFERPDCDSRNYAYFPVLIEDGFWTDRDGLYDALKLEGIHARKYFYPLTADEACFKNRYKEVPLEVARRLSKQVLCLPFYEEIDEESVARVLKFICR